MCLCSARWSFNLTLLIAGVFVLAAGGSPNFVTLASLMTIVGVGSGGRYIWLRGGTARIESRSR